MEQAKKTFSFKNGTDLSLLNCSNDLENFANFQPLATNSKKKNQSQEQFFLTADLNNFGNKIENTIPYFLK